MSTGHGAIVTSLTHCSRKVDLAQVHGRPCGSWVSQASPACGLSPAWLTFWSIHLLVHTF